MIRSIFKPVLAGIVAGAAVFFAGFFLLRILLFFFVIGAVIRFFSRRRRMVYHGYKPFNAPSFAHRYHNAGNVINIHSSKHNSNIISID